MSETDIVRVGINGFGRIGRLVARALQARGGTELVALNELEPDRGKLAYLYNYDSIYGAAPDRQRAIAHDGGLLIGNHKVATTAYPEIDAAPWRDHGVDILIDASGAASNLAGARRLLAGGMIRKAVATHAPAAGSDLHIIMGINHAEYDPARHNLVAGSICDANAIAHPLVAIDRLAAIEEGYVTTLHPWLGYQRLSDGFLPSSPAPGGPADDYALGRAAAGALIPKTTTAVHALASVLPRLAGRLQAVSYRVPTAVVCSADLTLRLASPISLDDLRECLEASAASTPYVGFSDEPLVSVDYKGRPESVIYDGRWLRVSQSGTLIKVVVWYDNEWGYANRVADLCEFIA